MHLNNDYTTFYMSKEKFVRRNGKRITLLSQERKKYKGKLLSTS